MAEMTQEMYGATGKVGNLMMDRNSKTRGFAFARWSLSGLKNQEALIRGVRRPDIPL